MTVNHKIKPSKNCRRVCMYVYLCVFVCRYASMYVCTYVRICMCACMCDCMYVGINVCRYVSMYVCIYVCMRVSDAKCLFLRKIVTFDKKKVKFDHFQDTVPIRCYIFSFSTLRDGRFKLSTTILP